MNHSGAIIGFALGSALLSSSAELAASECPAGSECAVEEGAQARSVSLGLKLTAGNAVSPFYQSRFPTAQGGLAETRIVTLETSFAVSDRLAILALVPFVSSGVRQPAGAYLRTAALANPLLGLRHSLPLGEDRVRPRLEWYSGVSLPLAPSSADPAALRARALALAAALESWTSREAFEEGALSLVTGVGVGVTPLQWLEVAAALRAPLLFQLRDRGALEDTETNGVGLLPSAELSGTAWIASWLSLALRTSVAAELAPLVEARDDAESGPLQWALAAAPTVIVSQHLSLGLDLNLPVGGPLSGTFGVALAVRGQL